MGESRIDNPETLAALGTQDSGHRTKTNKTIKHNTEKGDQHGLQGWIHVLVKGNKQWHCNSNHYYVYMCIPFVAMVLCVFLSSLYSFHHNGYFCLNGMCICTYAPIICVDICIFHSSVWLGVYSFHIYVYRCVHSTIIAIVIYVFPSSLWLYVYSFHGYVICVFQWQIDFGLKFNMFSFYVFRWSCILFIN